ncbi:MAG: hypothetical protein L0Y56_03960 [Nitrospira sp.]|nr:hypothetical protein [Nitrospira sp.]
MEQPAPKEQKKKIVLIAHESQLDDLLSWASFYCDFLGDYEVYTTEVIADLLIKKLHLPVCKIPPDLFDQTCKNGSASAEPPVDFVVFFWVASESLPNNPAIKTLLDITSLNDIPIAGNRAAANFMFPLALARLTRDSNSDLERL